MLTITDDYTAALPCPYEKAGGPGGLLFFDIETTGLSARTSQLYLIGCLYTDGSHFCLHQWFAENPSEEAAVLDAFHHYLTQLPKDCRLLHFNGNGFDIPYLRQRYDRYHKPFALDQFDSLDLYRLIRPYKTLLGLPSLRQKAIETYLGIERTDPFDGGQLIAVYEDYVDTRSESGLKALLLHNEEDVRNMPRLLTIFNLNSYMEADYSLVGERLHPAHCLDGSVRNELLVTLCSPFALPRPISLRLDNSLYLTADKTRISLAVPLFTLSLKHYFEDAKNYFYLPDEDRAVHKSVGIYVDKEHRVKATRDTCYIRREGVFLPCPAGMCLTEAPESCFGTGTQPLLFQRNRKDRDYYLEWPGEGEVPVYGDEAGKFWSEYVHALWRMK